jgi:DnaJ like chaperone protein
MLLPMTVWRRLSELAASVTAGGSSLATILARDGSTITGSSHSAVQAGGAQPSPQTSVAFTMAVIALSAKMAKADGVVHGVEVDAFHRAFQVAAGEQANVDRLFKLATQDIAGYEAYASQIARLLDHNNRLLGDVLDVLFHIATADRALHPGEDAFLGHVGSLFGFSPAEYRHARARFVHDPTSPYDVLGLDPTVGDAEVKSRQRKLVREHHPDLVIGRGLPPEMVDVATRKLAAINEAYSAIAKERGL